jgi:hypothetical protein
MDNESKFPAAPRSGIGMMLLVLASLGLNVFLAKHLLQRRPASSLPPATAMQSREQPVTAPATSAPATKALENSAATNPPPPFHWSEVESGDYRQYIANLRAVGCPEQIIRDIIMADVNQLFAPRVAAIWRLRSSEYWQKTANEQPGPDQMKQLMALSKDKTAILHELLGVRVSEQGLIDTLFLQLHGSESQLLFLPPEKRAAALQVLADADFATKETELHSRKRYPQAEEQKLFDEKLKLLAKSLSPEELLEFRLRHSQSATSLRSELEFFNCTPEEFQRLVESRNANQKLGNLLDRGAAMEEARKLFGEERAQEFERVTDLYYINARRVAEEHGLPPERADQTWEVTREVRAAVALLSKNPDVPSEERARQIQALAQSAETRLNELLGEKAAQGVIRDLRVVLNARLVP